MTAKKFLATTAASLAIGASLCSPLMANTLQSIDYSMLSGNRAQIVLTTSDPVTNPGSFATDNPARISVDLPNTTSALKDKTKSLSAGVARSVTAIEAEDKTRVVINLVTAVPYDVSSSGNQITVLLNGSSNAENPVVAAPTKTYSKASTSSLVHRVEKIDFRRGERGTAKVEVTLSDANSIVDMRKEGESIVLDFVDSVLEESQAGTLDVTDFATPVKSISTQPNRNNVRMSIAVAGNYEHMAYQANNLYTVEIRELTKKEQIARQAEVKVFQGDRLSLNFQDIEVRSVLQLLADFTGINMVVSDTVDGRITLRLKNVPWDQALDIILKTKGLTQRRNDNVILVAPTEEVTAREELEMKSTQQVEELAPLQTELIQLNYAKAKDLSTLLKSKTSRLLSERGNVSIDDRTNTLVVQDTPKKLQEIRTLLIPLDIPVRQVLIESRVVIANDDFARDLGVRFGFNRAFDVGGDSFGLIGGGKPGDLSGTYGIAPGIENPADSEAEALLTNLPATLGGDRGGAVNFLIGKAGSYLLQLELSAMQQEGKGEIVSSPKVITSDKHKAVIMQGQEIPYLEATSSGATNVAFKEAVLKLEVTPYITPDQRVVMDLIVTKDKPDWTRAVLNVPPIDTKKVQTSVLVGNGETVVLGGVFEQTTEQSKESVPFLADIPLIGYAFQQNLNRNQQLELLIFVTPKILKDALNIN